MTSDYDVTEAMIRYGGGFVSGLGQLFRHADDENKAKLKGAFPEYWQKYEEMAIGRRQHADYLASPLDPRD